MRLSEIAKHVGGRVVGGDVEAGGVASIESATAREVVFVESEKHLAAALASKAAAVIAGEFADVATTETPRSPRIPEKRHSKPLIIAKQPRLAFARAAELLCPGREAGTGVHATAVVHESARLGKGVSVGVLAVLSENVIIGDKSAIGSGTLVGAGVRIGADCDIKSNVSIYPGTTIGDRVIVHAGAVLGSDGFGFVRDEHTGRYAKFPQVGRLEIGDEVEIGANSTVDRGALDATVIGRGTKLDNLVHVGHNVRIGENVVIAAQTGISGSSVIEDGAVIAGQVGIADHVTIQSGAILGAQCGVPSGKVIRGKGTLFWGTPARPIKQYLKELAVLARLAKK
ncbi:MAG: UDP-3-O-(3-hydroxymyristoyl)glucosamine N-acyltransferase [Acidobacteriia bacterium]|nr:UDP-3-O-(3-hydroxymyristoyl)glucosamine N-acyltransferase [Terriglobia bacterium]